MSVTWQRAASPPTVSRPGARRPGRRTTAAVLLVTAALVAGCSVDQGGPAATDAPAPSGAQGDRLVQINAHPREDLRTGGTLTLPIDVFPRVWNALHADGAEPSLGVITSATDPVLYDYDAQGTVSARPEYLTAMPSEQERDGRQVVTYDLNPEAVWNDGTPIDHTAFEAVWRASRQADRRGGFAAVSHTGYVDIESITAGTDAHQVVVTFHEGRSFHPVSDLFTTLLHPAVATPEIFNEGFRGADFHPEWRSGPFTLERLDLSGKTVTLTRNPRWWGRAPLLDRIVLRQLEESASLTAFAAHEIDGTRVETRARYARAAAIVDADIRRSRRLTTGVLVLNSDDPLLADIAVRKAFWQAVDREQWKRVRFAGMNWVEDPIGSAMYYSFQPQARDNMPAGHDVAAAKAGLEAAGWALGADGVYAKDGTRLRITYVSFGDDPMTADLDRTLATQLATAGIELALRNVTYQAFLDALRNRDFGAASLGLGATTPSPVTSACQAMCSDDRFNLSGVGTPELDARLRALGTIADPAAQAQAVNDLERSWMALYGQMPLANGPEIWAYRRDVANLGPAAFAGLHPHWEDVGRVGDAPAS